jgi:hypothetical protein
MKTDHDLRWYSVALLLALAASGCGAGELGLEDAEDDFLTADLLLALSRAKPGVGEFWVDGEALLLDYDELDGQLYFEGDILLDANDRVQEGPTAAAASSQKRWPGGVMPYAVASNVKNKDRIPQAIALWGQANVPVKFVERTNERDYVLFQDGSGCSSMVGRTGGKQTITLSSSCSVGSTAHEMGHALGLFHEQSRSDRDQHLTVNWGNIQSGYDRNFKTWKERGGGGMDVGAYNPESIMHYSSMAFSKNGKPTLLKKDGSRISGQRKTISTGDAEAIRLMYKQ